jgi:insulysin
MVIVSQNHPGNWDQKEKWYGTEYRHEKIPDDLMEDIKKAAAVSPKERLSALHLPQKNGFIPNDLDLEVKKKDVNEPALDPRLLRNDDIVRTWWKKDNTFRVPLTYVGVHLRTPLIYASAENTVRADLFITLVNVALEERSQYARLAGLNYSLSRDARGLLLLVGGYSGKLPTLLKQVVTTMRDLRTEHRFETVKERRVRAYKNWQLGHPYTQVDDYIQWLNAPDRYFTVEELTNQFQGSTIEDFRLFTKQMLSQMLIEVYVHGNTYKEDASSITNMIESILKPRALPRDQWPVMKSLLLTEGSNYVFRKTLEDKENVNHCVETWFYAGSRDDREVCTKTMLLDQMLRGPAFDQLRTKEQLGYVVFSGSMAFSTTYGFYFCIQSEMRPKFLDARIEAFLMGYAHTLGKMTEKEFEAHKRSLINTTLEKPMNLGEEWVRHWSQITDERYDFEQGKSRKSNPIVHVANNKQPNATLNKSIY